MTALMNALKDVHQARRIVEEATPKRRLSTRTHSQAYRLTAALADLALRADEALIRLTEFQRLKPGRGQTSPEPSWNLRSVSLSETIKSLS